MKKSLTITSLSSTGEGIGTLDGLKIFVDHALPGETVSMEITEQKKSYAKARLLSIIEPSTERIRPPCPLFYECGGCQIMHLNYSAQLHIKWQKVKDALERIGGFQDCNVLPCIASPSSLGYRNKIQLPVVWNQGTKTIGLYRKQTHEIIPIKQCLIQNQQGDEILAAIIEGLDDESVRHVLIRNAIFQNEALVIFVTQGESSQNLRKFAKILMEKFPRIKGVVENINRSSSNVILGQTYRLLAGRPFIYETLLNKTFKISPSAFFQVNSEQTEKLYEKAIELADIQPSDTVIDAYCGVGTLALFAADKASQGYGIECISQAIIDAKENARLNRITNCSFVCGKAEIQLKKFKNFDTVFLNPPRKGCAPELLATLLEREPSKLIYISCDPATLARDLAILNKRYLIQTIQPFDMFPQTMHVETLVKLIKQK